MRSWTALVMYINQIGVLSRPEKYRWTHSEKYRWTHSDLLVLLLRHFYKDIFDKTKIRRKFMCLQDYLFLPRLYSWDIPFYFEHNRIYLKEYQTKRSSQKRNCFRSIHMIAIFVYKELHSFEKIKAQKLLVFFIFWRFLLTSNSCNISLPWSREGEIFVIISTFDIYL